MDPLSVKLTFSLKVTFLQKLKTEIILKLKASRELRKSIHVILQNFERCLKGTIGASKSFETIFI